MVPGNYELKIKATDNSIESDIKTVQIHIRSPWWYTWWAIACYVGISIVLISVLTLLIRKQFKR